MHLLNEVNYMKTIKYLILIIIFITCIIPNYALAIEQSEQTQLPNGNYLVETNEGYYISNMDGSPISDLYLDVLKSKYSELILCSSGNGYGVVNFKNEIVIPLQYDIIYDIINKDTSVFVALKNNTWYVINLSGEVILSKQCFSLGGFSNGFACMYDANGLHYVNLNGEKVFTMPEDVDEIYPFFEDVALICKDGLYTYINKNGVVIDNIYFNRAARFSSGYAVVANEITDSNGKMTVDWFVIDKNLNKVFDIDGEVYGPTEDDYVLNDGCINVLDYDAKEITTVRVVDVVSEYDYVEVENGIKLIKFKSEVSTVTIPTYVNDKKVVSIAGNAFNNNSIIKSISLPNSEITLEKNAISSCPNLESVYVPNADTVIIDGAISNCPNVTITGKPASTANIYAITNNIAFRATSTQTVRISDVVTDNATGTVHATVTNTSGKEFNNIQAIVALYSNGKMTDTKTYDIEKLPNNDSVGISMKFNTNNIYEYKIFLWESLQTIKPISDVYVPEGIMKSTVSAAQTPTKEYDVSVSNVVTNTNAKTISASVKNTGNKNIADAVVYVAAYDNGKLLEAQQCDIASLNAGETQNIEASFKTSDIYDYKIFVWDSATTLKPLSQVTE